MHEIQYLPSQHSYRSTRCSLIHWFIFRKQKHYTNLLQRLSDGVAENPHLLKLNCCYIKTMYQFAHQLSQWKKKLIIKIQIVSFCTLFARFGLFWAELLRKYCIMGYGNPLLKYQHCIWRWGAVFWNSLIKTKRLKYKYKMWIFVIK